MSHLERTLSNLFTYVEAVQYDPCSQYLSTVTNIGVGFGAIAVLFELGGREHV